MIAESLNPDKPPVDYLQVNIVDLDEERQEAKEEQRLRMQEIKRER